MARRLVALLCIAAAGRALAQASPDPSADQQRLRTLEEQVRALEQRLPPPAPLAPAPPAKPQPLDVREPPFGEFDFAWMNGNNPQPASLLTVGPLTWSLYIDTYYA